jgi:hypothetical protein
LLRVHGGYKPEAMGGGGAGGGSVGALHPVETRTAAIPRVPRIG